MLNSKIYNTSFVNQSRVNFKSTAIVGCQDTPLDKIYSASQKVGDAISGTRFFLRFDRRNNDEEIKIVEFTTSEPDSLDRFYEKIASCLSQPLESIRHKSMLNISKPHTTILNVKTPGTGRLNIYEEFGDFQETIDMGEQSIIDKFS